MERIGDKWVRKCVCVGVVCEVRPGNRCDSIASPLLSSPLGPSDEVRLV